MISKQATEVVWTDTVTVEQIPCMEKLLRRLCPPSMATRVVITKPGNITTTYRHLESSNSTSSNAVVMVED